MEHEILRLAPLPARVNAVTVVDDNGDFNIYVNENLSIEEQRRAYKHELEHIRQNHLFINKSVEECEAEAECNNYF